MRKSPLIASLTASVLVLGMSACSSDGATEPAANDKTDTAPSASAEAADGESDAAAPEASGETLIVYTNSNSDGRAEWLTEKAKEDGFDIQIVGQGGGDTTNKLIAEKNNPVADVVFGLNHMYFEQLEASDILTDYTPAWSGEVDEALADADDSKSYWPVVQQGILLACNADAENLPSDWTDLWNDPKFEGRYQTETGLGGATTQLVFSGILTQYKEDTGDLGIADEGWEQIQGYFEKGSPAEEGKDLYARMADGTVDCGQMWSSGVPAFEETYDIKTHVVTPEGGMPFAVEQVALVNGSKKEEDAKAFIDWFGSAETQSAWTKEFDSMPANKGAIENADPEIVEFHESLEQRDMDWEFITENMNKWIEKIELEYMN